MVARSTHIEATPDLEPLLARVRNGETLVITRAGRPVASIAPVAEPVRSDAEVEDLVRTFEQLSSQNRLDGDTIESMVREGRR